MADPMPVVLDDSSEDFTKRTFDFYRDDDSVIDTLSEFGAALGVDELSAAVAVSTYPYESAVPARLRLEAKRVLSR